MSKPMSEQMQKVVARYEKATGKKFCRKTNADRIRSMTDEELVAWLEEVDCYNCDCCVYQRECRLEYGEAKHDCVTGRIKWLKQPYKEGV